MIKYELWDFICEEAKKGVQLVAVAILVAASFLIYAQVF